MSLSLLIHSYYPSLTKSEQKVADVLQEMSQEEIIHITLSALAQKCGVGEATILRFCNKIGCDKFPSLKLLLAKEMEEDQPKDFDNSIERLAFETNQVIENTAKLLSSELLNEAVNLIDEAQQIYFFGVGSSGLSALEAQGNFLRIGKKSTAINDSHFQAMQASTTSSHDLIIAFSLTGNTKDIYDSLTIAKENGTKIIAITNYIESSIAKVADVTLLTAAKEHIYKGGSLAGTFSQLFVVDALKQEYYRRHEQEVKHLREKTAKAIINKSL